MSTESGLVLRDLAVGPWGTALLPPTSLDVARGASLALLGDAGSGKTTVLTTLAGRRAPAAGTVRFDGAPLLPALVGYAEQQHDLPDGMTAAEHLAVPLLALGRRLDDWSAIERLLTDLGLPPEAHHNLLEQLSGGQQQRIAVARALVAESPLICLDDPVSELDGASAELVWTALRAAVDRGAVLVVATPRAADADRLDQVVRLG